MRLAVEHAYTFGEEIPFEILLEDMALLYQEYTMKPGVRPFGCSLLVGVLGKGSGDGDGAEGGFYRVDPSGAVQRLGSGVVFVGRGDGDAIVQRVKHQLKEDENDTEKIETVLVDALREDLVGGKRSSCQSIVCARLSKLTNVEDKMWRVPVNDPNSN